MKFIDLIAATFVLTSSVFATNTPNTNNVSTHQLQRKSIHVREFIYNIKRNFFSLRNKLTSKQKETSSQTSNGDNGNKDNNRGITANEVLEKMKGYLDQHQSKS
ncbi:hypothetical protein K502DRAFT_324393 [Neoconidiobolus thromboides FSU 785]|nr:hypothetical protein K502DRAFT_324393 [Neoconidiobolus thromboides FSU 785]